MCTGSGRLGLDLLGPIYSTVPSPQHHPHVLKMSCRDFRKVVFIEFKAPFRRTHVRSSLIISCIPPCAVHPPPPILVSKWRISLKGVNSCLSGSLLDLSVSLLDLSVPLLDLSVPLLDPSVPLLDPSVSLLDLSVSPGSHLDLSVSHLDLSVSHLDLCVLRISPGCFCVLRVSPERVCVLRVSPECVCVLRVSPGHVCVLRVLPGRWADSSWSLPQMPGRTVTPAHFLQSPP